VTQFTVEQIDIQPEVLEHVRDALPDGDPYRGAIEDHRLELRAHHHPTTFVTFQEGEPAGYAFVRHLPNKPEGVLDIIVPPSVDELTITETLLERVLEHTPMPLSWWTRAPRDLRSAELVAPYGGRAQRVVLRLERTIDEPLDVTLATRGFVDGDESEIVRINNEAFADHADRSHLTENDISEQLRLFGNRNEDLRLTAGGFCWTKRCTPSESEVFVLAVDDAHRHLGLGERLFVAALEHIRTNHRTKNVCLYVERDNTAAIRLYERNGFLDSGQTLYSVFIPERKRV